MGGFTAEERDWVIASVVGGQALAGVAVTPEEAGALLDGLAGTPLPPIGAGAGVTEQERAYGLLLSEHLALKKVVERLRAENERLRAADAVLTRWGKLRAEYAALRGRQDHAPTYEESVAAWARMDELEAEIELAFLAVRLASDARALAE